MSLMEEGYRRLKNRNGIGVSSPTEFQVRHAGSCQLRHKAKARKPTVTPKQAIRASQPGASIDHSPT